MASREIYCQIRCNGSVLPDFANYMIEAIPNVSEGRRHAAVEAMAHAFTRGADAWLLDTHEDASHHRSVVTAALEPDALIEASCALLVEAL